MPHPNADWCPRWLFDLVFAKDDDEAEGTGPLRSYLLVDATLFHAVAGPLSLEELDLPVMSLFQGQAARDHADTAPYIVDITPPQDTMAEVPLALKAFARRYWGKQSGVVLRSRASLEQMRAHLRHFTRLNRADTGAWVLFRFWDSRIALPYFSSLAQWPAREATWFRPSNCPPIEAMVLEGDNPEEAWRLTPSLPMLHPASRPDNRLHEYELAVLRDASRAHFHLQLTRGLTGLDEAEGNQPLRSEVWQQFVQSAHAEATLHGFSTRQSIARFALLCAKLGLDFLSDPRFDLRDRQVMLLQNASETERFEAALRIEKDFQDRLVRDGGKTQILERAMMDGQAFSPEQTLLKVAPTIAAPMGAVGIADFLDRLTRYLPTGQSLNEEGMAPIVARAAIYGTRWTEDPRYAVQAEGLLGYPAPKRLHTPWPIEGKS